MASENPKPDRKFLITSNLYAVEVTVDDDVSTSDSVDDTMEKASNLCIKEDIETEQLHLGKEN